MMLGASPAATSDDDKKNMKPVMRRIMENCRSTFRIAENNSYLEPNTGQDTGDHSWDTQGWYIHEWEMLERCKGGTRNGYK